MHVRELRRREQVEPMLAKTLSAGWSEQYGKTIRVTTRPKTGAQPWRLHPLFSALYVDNLHSVAQRYLVDGLRYTTRPWHLLPQWAVATALGLRPLLRLAGRPTLWVTPPIPQAENLLVIPGNRRLRVHDFSRRTSRVLLKPGYPVAAINTELRVRGAGPGPFPALLASGETWFEEPLITGFALPRCPPWRPRGAYEQRALSQLCCWQAVEVEQCSAIEHAETLRAGIDQNPGGLAPSPLDRALLDWLTELAGCCDLVEVGRTHGDFQAGNVVVETVTHRVWIVDWETSARRFAAYDLMVYALGCRWTMAGLGERLARFVHHGSLEPVTSLLPRVDDPRWRRAAAGLFLLEELCWRFEEHGSLPDGPGEDGGPLRALIAEAAGLRRTLESRR